MSKRRRITPPGGWGSIQTPEEPSQQPNLFAPLNEKPQDVEPVAADAVDLANPAPQTSAPEMGQAVEEESPTVSDNQVLNDALMVGYQQNGFEPLEAVSQSQRGAPGSIQSGSIAASTAEDLDGFTLELDAEYRQRVSTIEEQEFLEYTRNPQTGAVEFTGPALPYLFADDRYHKHLARTNRVVVQRGDVPKIYFPNRANLEDFTAGRSKDQFDSLPDDRRQLYQDATSDFVLSLGKAYEETGDLQTAARSWRSHFNPHSDDHFSDTIAEASRILGEYNFEPTENGLTISPKGVTRDTVQRSVSVVAQAPGEMEVGYPSFNASVAPIVKEASRAFMQAVYNSERTHKTPINISVNGQPLVSYFSDQNADRSLDIETSENRIDYDALGLREKPVFSSILARLLPKAVQSGPFAQQVLSGSEIISALSAAPEDGVVVVDLSGGNKIEFRGSQQALIGLARGLVPASKSAELIRNNFGRLSSADIPGVVQPQSAIVPTGELRNTLSQAAMRRFLMKEKRRLESQLLDEIRDPSMPGGFKRFVGATTRFYNPVDSAEQRSQANIADLGSQVQAIDYLLGQGDVGLGTAMKLFNEGLEVDAEEYRQKAIEGGQVRAEGSSGASGTELVLRQFIQENADKLTPLNIGRFPATMLDSIRQKAQEDLGAPLPIVQDLPEEDQALQVIGSTAQLDRFGNPVVVLPDEPLLKNPNKPRNSRNLPRVEISDQQAVREWMNHINRTSLTPVDDIYQHFSGWTGYDFVSPEEFRDMESPGWVSRFFVDGLRIFDVPPDVMRTSYILSKKAYHRVFTSEIEANAGRHQMFDQIFSGFDFTEDPNAESKAREVATKYYDAAVLGRGQYQAAIDNSKEYGWDFPLLPSFSFSVASPEVSWAYNAALSLEEAEYLAQYAGDDTSLTWKALNSPVAQEVMELGATLVFDPFLYSAFGRSTRYLQSGDDVYAASRKFMRTSQELAVLADRAGITEVIGESGFAQFLLEFELDLAKARSLAADAPERAEIIDRIRRRTEVLHDIQLGTGKRVVSLRAQGSNNVRAAQDIKRTGAIPESGPAVALREQAEAQLAIAKSERDRLGTLLDPAADASDEAARVRNAQAMRAAERRIAEAETNLLAFDDAASLARLLESRGRRQMKDANLLERSAKKVDGNTRLLRGSHGIDGSFTALDSFRAGARSRSRLGLKQKDFTSETAEEFLMGRRRAPRVTGTEAVDTVRSVATQRQSAAAAKLRDYRAEFPAGEPTTAFGHWLRKAGASMEQIDDGLRNGILSFDDLAPKEKWLYFAHKTGTAPTKLPGWFIDAARKSFGTTAMQPLLDPATKEFLRRLPKATWENFQQALRDYQLKTGSLESELLVEINRITETAVRVRKELRAAAPDRIKRLKASILEQENLKRTSVRADEKAAADLSIRFLEGKITLNEHWLRADFTPQSLLLEAANEIETGAGLLARRPELVPIAAQIDALVKRYADDVAVQEEAIKQMLVLIRRQLNIEPEVLATLQENFALLEKLSVHPQVVANERITVLRKAFTEAANQRAAFRNVLRNMSPDTLATLLERVRLEILGKPINESDLAWVSRAVADVFKDQPAGLDAFNQALMTSMDAGSPAIALRKLASFMQDTKHGQKWTAKSGEITVEAVRNAALRIDREAEAIDRFLLGEVQDFMLGDITVGRQSSMDELRSVADILAREHYINAQALVGAENWDEFMEWVSKGDAAAESVLKDSFVAARSHMERHNMLKNMVPNEVAREQSVLASVVDSPEASLIKSKLRQEARDTRTSPEELEATLKIVDARAVSWALETGQSPSDWYPTYIADVRKGRGKLSADTLYQAGGPEYAGTFYSALTRYVEDNWPIKNNSPRLVGEAELRQLLTSKRAQQLKSQELVDLEVEAVIEQAFRSDSKISREQFIKMLARERVPIKVDVRTDYADVAAHLAQQTDAAVDLSFEYAAELVEYTLSRLTKSLHQDGVIDATRARNIVENHSEAIADEFLDSILADKDRFKALNHDQATEEYQEFVWRYIMEDDDLSFTADQILTAQELGSGYELAVQGSFLNKVRVNVDSLEDVATRFSSISGVRAKLPLRTVNDLDELALTLPGAEAEFEFLVNVDGYRLNKSEMPEQTLSDSGRGDDVKRGKTFEEDAHFPMKEGDSNLIHVRASIRTVTDANGNDIRTLHIAEIQSDLHQQAKDSFSQIFNAAAKDLVNGFERGETAVRIVPAKVEGEVVGWNIENWKDAATPTQALALDPATNKPWFFAKKDKDSYEKAIIQAYALDENTRNVPHFWNESPSMKGDPLRELRFTLDNRGYGTRYTPHAPFQSTWLPMGIRLATAKAVELGLDGVSFDTAITNIYRYHKFAFDHVRRGRPARFTLSPDGTISAMNPRPLQVEEPGNLLGDRELSARLLSYSDASFSPEQVKAIDFIDNDASGMVADVVSDFLISQKHSDVFYMINNIDNGNVGANVIAYDNRLTVSANEIQEEVLKRLYLSEVDPDTPIFVRRLGRTAHEPSTLEEILKTYTDYTARTLLQKHYAQVSGSSLVDFARATDGLTPIERHQASLTKDFQELIESLYQETRSWLESGFSGYFRKQYKGYLNKTVDVDPSDLTKVKGVPGTGGHVVAYDRVIPNTVKKLYKKDGLKLEPATTRVPSVNELPDMAGQSESGMRSLADYYRRTLGEQGYSATQGADVDVRLLRFTDEFKSKISKDGQPLYQMDQASKKGAVRFLEDGRAILYLFKNADASTFIHEIGHILRRQLPASQLRAIEEFAGAEAGFFSIAAEEKFARAFERFVMEHVAPEGASEDLVRALTLIKTSMQGIYENLFGVSGSAIDIEMSDQVRNIFSNMIHGTPVNERLARKLARESVAARKGASQAVLDAKIKGRTKGPFVRDSAAFMRLEEAVLGATTETEAIARVRKALRSIMGDRTEIPEISRWVERYSNRVGRRLFSIGPDADRTTLIKDLQRIKESVVKSLKKSDDLSKDRLGKKEASIRRAVKREAKTAPGKMEEILAEIDGMFTMRLPKGDGTSGEFVIELNDWQRNLWSDFNELTKNLTDKDKTLAAFTALRDAPTTPESMRKMWATLENDLGFEPGVAQQWSLGARLQASQQELEPVVNELKNLIQRYEALYEKHGMDFMANPTVMLQQWGVVDYFPHVVVDGVSITTPRGSLKASGSIEAGRRQVENSRRPVSFGEMLSSTMDAERRRENLGTIREINMMLESAGEFGVEPLHLAARYLQANRKITAQDLLFNLIDTGVIRPIFPRKLADGTTASAAKVAQDTGYVPIFQRASDEVQRYSREQILFATRKELAELGITDPATLESILDPRSGKFWEISRFADWSKESRLVRQMEAVEDTIAMIRYTEIKGGAAKLTDVRSLVRSALELDTVEAQDAALKALASSLTKKASTLGKAPRFGPNDLRTYFAEGQEAWRLYIPRQVQVAMDDIITADFVKSGELKAVVDRVQNFFKARLTILAIAFHSRNAVSNVVQSMMNLAPTEVLSPTANWYAGTLATGVAHYERYGGMRKARKWFAAARRDGESATAYAGRKTRGSAFEQQYGRLIDEGVDLGDGKKIDIDDAYRVLKDNGVLSESFTQYVDIADVESSLVNMMVNHGIEGKIGTAKKMASATEDFFVVTLPTLVTGGIPVTLPKAYGATVGRVVENQARILNFRGGVKTGLSHADSAADVARFLFDYGDLTSFQKQWMRTFFPFFTWNNKNFWLQLDQLRKYPAYFSMFNHLVYEGLPNIANASIEQEFGINTINPNDISQVRGRERHAFSRISMPVPGYQNVYLEGFGLPQEAFQEYVGPFVESFEYIRDGLLGSFNGTDYKSDYWNYSDRKPLMRLLGQGNIPTRIVLEAMQNHHSFYDKPISELTNGRVIGDTIDALSKYGNTGEIMAEYLKSATGYNVVQMVGDDGFIKEVPIVTGTQNWLVGTMPWGRVLKQAAAYTDTVSISHAADIGAADSAGAFSPAYGGGYTTEIPVMLRALEALTGFRITQRNPVWERRLAEKRLRDFMNDQYKAKKLIVETEFEMGAEPF